MAGMFDDLIPQQAAPAAQPVAAPAAGMFDDLIPKVAAPVSEPQQAQDARNAAAARTSAPFRGHFDAGNTSVGDVGKVVTQGAKGINTGMEPLVRVASAVTPQGMVNTGARALGFEPPLPDAGDAYHKAFVEGAPPTTPGQKVARAGGEMVGANMPLLLGGAGLAASGARAGVPLIEQATGGVLSKIRGAADAVLEYMAAHPVAAARSDTAGAALSGAGGETGREIAEAKGASPTGQKLSEMIGQFGTPAAAFTYAKVAPTRVVGEAAVGAAKKALGALPEEAIPGFMKPEGGTVADRLRERLQFSNREGKYANPDEPAPAEPNFATRQMDAGALERQQRATGAVQKDIAAATSTPEGKANVATAADVKAKIPGFEPGVAKETGDPALLNLQQSLEAKATGPELRAAQGRSAGNEAAIRKYYDEAMPPVADSVAAGEKLRGIRNENAQVSKDQVNKLRGEIGNPEASIQVGDQQMTVDAALNRRAEINQTLRRYRSATLRTEPDIKQMDTLNAERDVLDGAIKKVNDPGLKEYLRYYREEDVPRFREGPARDVGRYKQTSIGKDFVRPEDVPSKFMDSVSSARQFNRTFGDNPEARKIIAGAIRERAPDIMDAVKMRKFIDGNKEVLNTLLTPKHLADLDTVIKAAEIEGQIPKPKGATEQPSSVADKVGKFAGISIPSFLSRFRSMEQGRTGKPYTAVDIGLQMFSKFSTREVEAAWKEALYNPKVAEDLASAVSGKATKPIISRLHNYLLTVGARDATEPQKPVAPNVGN